MSMSQHFSDDFNIRNPDRQQKVFIVIPQKNVFHNQHMVACVKMVRRKEKVATKKVTKTKTQNQVEPIVPLDVQVEFEKYLRLNECIDLIIVFGTVSLFAQKILTGSKYSSFSCRNLVFKLQRHIDHTNDT